MRPSAAQGRPLLYHTEPVSATLGPAESKALGDPVARKVHLYEKRAVMGPWWEWCHRTRRGGLLCEM